MDKGERPRILITGPSLDAVSGVSTHLRQLLDSPLAREYRFHHVQIGREGRHENPAMRPARLLADYSGFVRALASYRPHVVHLNPSMNRRAFWRDLLLLLIAKLLRRKIVYQVHGGAAPQQFFNTGLMRRFLKWVLGLPDAVVVLGSVEEAAYESFRGFKCLAVIPNAIDIAPYAARKKTWTADTAQQLVYIGRLTDTKGVIETLDALMILRRNPERWPNLKFLVAGSGPAEKELRRRAAAASLSEVVTFVGSVFGDQKLDFWQGAGIFVFPTYHQEGLPYSVLESLASGTPMITTRAGNIASAVEHGVQGLLVEPRNPDAVSKALVSLLESSERLREMSGNCRRTARERYTVDRLARDFSSLYQRLLSST